MGWLALSTGRWTTFSVAGADARAIGWHDNDLLVQTFPTSGTADVVSASPDGSTRVVVTYQDARDYESSWNDLVSVAVDRLPAPAG